MKDYSALGDYTDEDLDCALEHLVEASEIMKNAELMKLIKQHAEKRTEQITSVAELRKVADEKASGKKVKKEKPMDDLKKGAQIVIQLLA